MTVGGQCPSCGYVLPDKDELDYMTHVMNAEPQDYPDPEPEPMPMRDVTPEEAAEQDIFPPKYYEAQAEQQQRVIPKVEVAHFSKPPAVGNMNNLPQNTPYNSPYNMPQNNRNVNQNINQNNQYNMPQNNQYNMPQNNQYNYRYSNQGSQSTHTGFADSIRNIAQRAMMSRFSKLFVILFFLFCPSILMIILSAIMLKTNDPAVQRIARIAIFIGIFKIFVPWFM